CVTDLVVALAGRAGGVDDLVGEAVDEATGGPGLVADVADSGFEVGEDLLAVLRALSDTRFGESDVDLKPLTGHCLLLSRWSQRPSGRRSARRGPTREG